MGTQDAMMGPGDSVTARDRLPGLFPAGPLDIHASVRRVVLALLLPLAVLGLGVSLAEGDQLHIASMAVAVVGTVIAAAVPWQRLPRDAFGAYCAFAVSWLAWWVGITGGAYSPHIPLTFLGVAVCAITLSRPVATVMAVLAAAAASLPFAYQTNITVTEQQELIIRTLVLIVAAIAGAWLSDEVRKAVDVANLERARLENEQTVSSDLLRTQDQRTEYLSVLAHELRNPLTGINAAARVLARDVAGTKSETTARGIANESRHAMDLLDGLTDVASLESGRMRLALRPMDLAALVEESMAATVDDHKVSLRSSGEPLIVLGDDRRLGQVIRNLVSNAGKYSPPGAEIQVSIGVSANRRDAIVQVRDEGPGIPPAERTRLFEKFQRLSTAGGTRGSGLGLYISRGIVHDHGGEMWADWPAGGGSVFSFSIPLSGRSRSTTL